MKRLPASSAHRARTPWSAGRPLLLGGVTIAVLVGGFGSWSIGTTIAGAVVASGHVQLEQKRQIVQHPDGGVVAKIAVQEGQPVIMGDLLLSFDGSLPRSELAIVEGQLYELLARRIRLEAERDEADAPEVPADLASTAAERPDVEDQIKGQLRLFEARRETLSRQTEQLGKRRSQTVAQIAGVAAQMDALSTQLRLIRQELSVQEGLRDQGLARMTRVLALQREEAGLQGRAGELTALRAQSEDRVIEIDLEILRLAAARREDASTQLRDIGSSKLELAERRRALIERIDRLDVRAPVAGVVLGLSVTTPRSVVRSAEQILYLIPQDQPLVITAKIPPLDIDEVHVGQSVRLVFPGLTARDMPELSGRVALVSADALADQDNGQTFYRAQIALNSGEVSRLPGQTLLPGMPVELFIQTSERTPMAYFIQPFRNYLQRALRES